MKIITTKLNRDKTHVKGFAKERRWAGNDWETNQLTFRSMSGEITPRGLGILGAHHQAVRELAIKLGWPGEWFGVYHYDKGVIEWERDPQRVCVGEQKWVMEDAMGRTLTC